VTGDKISFDYSGGTLYDWYEVAIVLYRYDDANNEDTIDQVKVFRGSSTNASEFFNVGEDGTYFVRSFAASYDFTNFGLLGSKVTIKSVELKKA